jgi:hypothetical protein
MNSTPQINCRFLTVTASIKWRGQAGAPEAVPVAHANFWVDSLHFFHCATATDTANESVLRFDVAEIQSSDGYLTSHHSDPALKEMIATEIQCIIQNPTHSYAISISIDRNSPSSLLFEAYRKWLRSIARRKPDPLPSRRRKRIRKLQQQQVIPTETNSI